MLLATKERNVFPKIFLYVSGIETFSKAGMAFASAPAELANRFSVENRDPFTQYWLGRSFGFHGAWNASAYGISL
jgi:hypothetical protein